MGSIQLLRSLLHAEEAVQVGLQTPQNSRKISILTLRPAAAYALSATCARQTLP